MSATPIPATAPRTAAVIRAFIEKERLEVGSRGLILSLYIGLPLLLALVPVAAALALGHEAANPVPGAEDELHTLLAIVGKIPDLAGLPPAEAVALLLLRQMSVLLAIAPIALTSIAGSYSIVGEKTGQTIEPLLATPITDAQLLAGKVVAIGLPAVAATVAAGLVAALVADVGFQRFVLPDPRFLLLLFVVTPLAALLGLLATFHISSRASDVQSAQQIAGLLVLPFVVFLVGSMLNPLVFGTAALAGFAIVIAIADFALFRFTLARFGREEILTRWR
jgi:ABC-2 type transport system permease protein